MQCPNCHAPVRIGESYCRRCGADMPVGSKPDPAAKPTTEPKDGGGSQVLPDNGETRHTVLLPNGPPRGAAREPLPAWREADWPPKGGMVRTARGRRRRLRQLVTVTVILLVGYGLQAWFWPAAPAVPVEVVVQSDAVLPAASAAAVTATSSPDTSAPAAHGSVASESVPEPPARAASESTAPPSLDALRKRAETALASRQYFDAAAAIGLAREAQLSHPELEHIGMQAGMELWRRGDRERQGGRLAEAEKAYRHALLATVDDYFADDARYFLAATLQAAGRCEEAVSSARQVIKEYPLAWWYHDDALFLVAECQEKLGQTEQARATYVEVVRQYPNTASADAARRRLAR